MTIEQLIDAIARLEVSHDHEVLLAVPIPPKRGMTEVLTVYGKPDRFVFSQHGPGTITLLAKLGETRGQPDMRAVENVEAETAPNATPKGLTLRQWYTGQVLGNLDLLAFADGLAKAHEDREIPLPTNEECSVYAAGMIKELVNAMMLEEEAAEHGIDR